MERNVQNRAEHIWENSKEFSIRSLLGNRDEDLATKLPRVSEINYLLPQMSHIEARIAINRTNHITIYIKEKNLIHLVNPLNNFLSSSLNLNICTSFSDIVYYLLTEYNKRTNSVNPTGSFDTELQISTFVSEIIIFPAYK